MLYMLTFIFGVVFTYLFMQLQLTLSGILAILGIISIVVGVLRLVLSHSEGVEGTFGVLFDSAAIAVFGIVLLGVAGLLKLATITL